MHRHLSLPGVLAFAAATAIAFTLLATPRLTGQGLYYDEVHQAVAAFDYIGRHEAPGFNVEFHGVPILNMSYSGALKSNIYGLYLRLVNPRFTVYSWRLTGILFVAAGIIAFYVIGGRWLSATGASIFSALFVTDTSILLMTRHDWGPVALALSLRLVLIGMWMAMASTDTGLLYPFAAGLIVGIAIFEKLSSVVLLAPFALMLATVSRNKKLTWTAGVTGLAAGSVPLCLVNIWSFFRIHRLASFAAVEASVPLSAGRALSLVSEYVQLGAGHLVRGLVFGETPAPFRATIDGGLVLCLLLLTIVCAVRFSHSHPMRAAGAMAAAYGAIAIGLFLLPHETSVHHWIIGSPFQYAAIAMVVSSLERLPEADSNGRWYRRAGLLAAAVMLAFRIDGLAAVERSLIAGRASARLDPSFTRIAELAASRSSTALFVSADWGTGTQLYCLGNGQPGLVHEPFWAADPGARMGEISQTTDRNTIYLLETDIAPQFGPAARRIVQFMMSSPEWQETTLEPEFQSLTNLRVWKFVRRTRP